MFLRRHVSTKATIEVNCSRDDFAWVYVDLGYAALCDNTGREFVHSLRLEKGV